MEEIWKDIEGYEGYYQISNLGRVKSLSRTTKFGMNYKTSNDIMLSASIGKRGYYVVSLNKDGVSKTFTLHRLIAKAFIPNPENKRFIDHINTIRTDNRIENLRWVTAKENANNSITLMKNRESAKLRWSVGKFANRRENLHYIKVQQFTKDGVFVKEYDSIKNASLQTGIDSSSISAVCLGTNPKRHTAGGFIWKHIGEYYRK